MMERLFKRTVNVTNPPTLVHYSQCILVNRVIRINFKGDWVSDLDPRNITVEGVPQASNLRQVITWYGIGWKHGHQSKAVTRQARPCVTQERKLRIVEGHWQPMLSQIVGKIFAPTRW